MHKFCWTALLHIFSVMIAVPLPYKGFEDICRLSFETISPNVFLRCYASTWSKSS